MKRYKRGLLAGIIAAVLLVSGCDLNGDVNGGQNSEQTDNNNDNNGQNGNKPTGSQPGGNTGDTGGGTEDGKEDQTPEPNVIWEGSADIDWDLNGVTIDALKITTKVVGFRFTFTTTSEGDLKLLSQQDWKDREMSEVLGDGILVDSGTDAKKLVKFSASKTNGSVTVLYSAAVIQNFAQYGLKFIGNNATVTKVEAIYNRSQVNPNGNNEELANLSSVNFAMYLANGWNLGNTLDAYSTGSKDNSGVNTETSWGMPATTREMIQAVKKAGFKSIRIPVSWHNHITDSTQLTIDSTWMARVKTIVDWAMDEGLFVILNVHHDVFAAEDLSKNYGYALSEDSSIQNHSKDYLTKVWTQIANEFKNYDLSLVFEVLNEPLYKYYDNQELKEAWTPEEDKKSTYNNIITSYEQTCLDAIRGTGGNNADRFLMCPGYAASPWYLDSFSFPKDTVSDKLILSVHAYDPYDFAMGDDDTFTQTHKSSLDTLFNKLSSTYTSKGRGVIMGEFSASDKNNDSERIKWVEYYCSKAKAAEVACVLWDNMVVYPNGNNQAERHGYLNREDLTWYFPEFIKIVVK